MNDKIMRQVWLLARDDADLRQLANELGVTRSALICSALSEMSGKKFYQIEYRIVAGAHFFTSEHPDLAGLCAASIDLEAAYNDVSIQIEFLLSHNLARDEQYRPVTPLEYMVPIETDCVVKLYWIEKID